ncbi:MAG: hypothetical protein HOQ07_02115 [Sinomonas sp.]|nr:hypothetical protein [Sinomonas sp.]
MAESWDELLDRLASDLAAAERQLSDPEAPAVDRWTPPTHLGALPERLVERAMGLVSRQAEVAARLDAARTTAGRHLAAVQSIPSPRPTGALYVDVRG